MASPSDTFPLSDLQHGILLNALSHPGAGVDTGQGVLEVFEDLDLEALREAWQRVVDRHDSLRASYRWQDVDEPLQQVVDHVEHPFVFEDWSALGHEERLDRFREWLRADRAREFDFSRAPVTRVTVIRFGERDYRVIWTIFHGLIDGRAAQIVLNEVFRTYDALRAGAPLALPPPPAFRDYVEWARAHEVPGTDAYWRERLAGFRVPTSMSTRRYAGPADPHRQQVFVSSTDVIVALKEMVADTPFTVTATIQAAWAILLALYSGQSDVLFAVVTTTRRAPVAGADRMVGMLINLLPMRVHVDDETSVANLLEALRTQWVDHKPYDHTSVAKFQGWSDVPPGTRLFGSWCSFDRISESEVFGTSHGDVRLNWHMQTSIPIGCGVFEGAQLRVAIDYDTALYDDAFVARLHTQFRMLLEQVARAPETRISDLRLLDDAERRRLLIEWNDTARDYPRDDLVHQQIERQGRHTPDAPAVVFEGRAVSYRELNARANRLAHLLRSRGVGPESLVGLCLTRSVEMVVGILGILKAGGAYVPIDPEYPDDRIVLILEDTAAVLLVTTPEVRSRVEGRIGETFVFGADDAALDAMSTQDLPLTVGHDNLAYVIHTSGSTGRPKGVMNTHGGILNRLQWMQETYGLDADDRVLQKTPFTFDVSVWEFLWPLMTGAGLVVARPGGHKDPKYLVDLIAEAGVTTLHFVPSMLRAFLGVTDLSPAAGLRRVICSGEALPEDLRDEFFERVDAELHNLYGPTEAAIDVTAIECRPEDRGAAVSIGRPIANTTTYVLDGSLTPVPLGVPGELCLGGLQLARGYAGRPDQTAEKFVPDPFASAPGARLYRTGDLVRYGPDGNIEFLGRIDTQVKLRGFRIELGEIEVALASQEGVRAAAVILWNEGADAFLVGYVVPSEGASVTMRELRVQLARRLPEYMVPGVLMPVASLPKTPSGKLDRKALPAPQVRRAAADEYAAPQTPIEEELVEIWRTLVPADHIGVHDSFFDLGGHSLLATQLVARLRRVFDVDLPITILFEAPTIAELAGRVDAARGGGSSVSGAGIEFVPRDGGQLPLSFAEQRLWFLDQMESGAGYNMPGAFRARGSLDVPALERSLVAIAERHEVLRTAFLTVKGEPLLTISDTAVFPLEVIPRRGLNEAERGAVVNRLASDEGHVLFDLAESPLARAKLIELADDDHVLLVTFHHIIFDGWSLSVFVRELMECYRAFAEGGEPELTPPALQYVDFAAWQRGWLEGETFERQLDYWTDELGDLTVLDLPADHPRPPAPSYTGREVQFELSPALVERVHELGREQGVTPAMFLLAAFQVLLARTSGQDDIAVGSPIANRVHPDLEHLIGFFVNTLVLRTDLAGDPTFAEVLRRVRVTSLGAYDNQDLPFERLVEELEPERDPSRNPLFQVAFMFQNMPSTEFELPGLVIGPAPLEVRAVRVDLEFHLFEVEGGILGRVIYATDLFEAETVTRMARHYARLVESAVAEPRARISELLLQDEGERGVILGEWSGAGTPHVEGSCIHELIEARASEAPEQIAVERDDLQLSYGELNARANQIAHALRERGVGPDTLVGLCCDRTPEMIVGLLGILKAGGAYLPLDPTYPAERLAYMLSDSGVQLLLTKAALLADLPEHGAETLLLDGDEFAAASRENPSLVTTPDNLAYVIYTSGSTGRPKGTLLAHRGLVSLAAEQGRLFGVDAATRALQFSSLSFDASTFDVMMALPRGATLVMGERQALMPGPDLHGFLREQRISIVTLPPTALAALPDEALPDLATITVAGEACSAELVSRWAPGRRFFNLYGPTEATIWSTVTELRAGEPSHIGRPIGNVTTYVLDSLGGVVPIGVAGELHIGGVGVARGYSGRPDLTAECFVPDPFSSVPGRRLYRSGDLVRWRPNGNLEFLGRIDDQVKLRGYRIELGEVEGVLDEHPAVRESAVAIREAGEGDRRLVAYVRCDEDVELVSAEADASQWQTDHVSQWQTVYDQSYAEVEAPAEAAFLISGWDSSYTGQALPAAEMRIWVDETAAGVRATGAERVLEMGCGSGLVLLNLLDSCLVYHGSDFSQPALDTISAQLERMPEHAAKVTLDQRTADDFSGIEAGHFDTVVLNSVVQYFPDAAYLREVLTNAVRAVGPGGRVFVGDVRSMPLMDAFHASVQLFRAPEETTREQLWQRVRHERNQDQELVIDPACFTQLAAELGTISHVEMQPKRGRYDNELSRFRYDVVLHVGEARGGALPAELDWLGWSRAALTLEGVRALLAEDGRETLALAEIPNRRVARDTRIVHLLEDAAAPGTAAELALAADAYLADESVEPEDLRELAESLGYVAHPSLAAGRADGSFDAVFAKRDRGLAASSLWAAMPTHTGLASGAPVTNRPLRGRFLRELVPHLRQWATDRLPEYMVPAVFTVLDEFPVTPSGKLDRRALPAPDSLRPDLAVEYEAPRSALEETLARIWMQVLGVDRVGARDNFFELGGDSMLSIQVVSAAREAGLAISARDLFEHQTVEDLVAAAGTSVAAAEQGAVTGEVLPTPITSWWFEHDLTDRHHFNQAFLLTAAEPLERELLEDALAALVEHHDALRLRARRVDGDWQLSIAEPVAETEAGASLLEELDLSGVPADELDARAEQEATRVQASLDLEAGPVLRAALLRCGAAGDRLLLAVHHLAVDVVSWGALLDDLARAFRQRRAGESVRLPPKTTSIQEWARRLRQHAAAEAVAREARYWLEQPWSRVRPLPRDLPAGANTVGSMERLSLALDEELTRAVLHEIPGAFNATAEDVLLAALGLALSSATESAHVAFDLEGHGRDEWADDLDASRTVGWFTTIHPVLLDVSQELGADGEPAAGLGALLQSVKEQLRAVPGKGRAFGLARYLGPEGNVARGLAALPASDVVFNYLGQLDRMIEKQGPWTASIDGVGASRSPRGERMHLLEVTAGVLGGRLGVHFDYGREVHSEERLQRLADGFRSALDGLAEAARSGSDVGFTDSDLAELGWDADDIEDLLMDD